MRIRFHVDATRTKRHLYQVKMEFDCPFDEPILEMPVWTPGSYLVRDYAKNLQQFSAQTRDGEELEWQKVNKTNWKLSCRNGDQVTITYYIYAFDLTVRTCYLDHRYGLISPAGFFFYLKNKSGEHTKNAMYRVSFCLDAQWDVFSSLVQDNETYIARDYDELVDSPFALAHNSVLETYDYTISRGNAAGSASCKTILIGHQGNQNIETFTDQLVKIQKESIKLFGDLPYDRYLWILYVVAKGGGGLEHKNSNVSIIPRWYFSGEEKKRARLLELESHEHFHTYNIKRIRPSQLGPFDYSHEVYTTLLWVAEGLTSHYDRITLPRADLISEELYWELQASDIKKLEAQPGRKITSLAQSSFDAWIKQYKPDENQINSTISYYLKGSVVGLLLDLEIRKQTSWDKSLDTFWKSAYAAYKKQPESGYPEDQFQKLMEEATGTDLEEFFTKYIHGRVELPINEYLELIGLKLEKNTEDKVFIGWNLDKTKTKVVSVLSNSPAEKGGISPKDEIVAINGYQIKGQYETLIENLNPDEEGLIHYFRDGLLHDTVISMEPPRPTKYVISEVDGITEEQKQRKKQLLSTDTR